MKVNVEKVLERDQKLSELDDRAGELLCDIVRLNELGTSENKTINLVQIIDDGNLMDYLNGFLFLLF